MDLPGERTMVGMYDIMSDEVKGAPAGGEELAVAVSVSVSEITIPEYLVVEFKAAEGFTSEPLASATREKSKSPIALTITRHLFPTYW